MSMSLRFVAACLLLPRASSLTLLSCVYGLSQCLTFKDDDGYDKARELGCPTSDDEEFFAGRQSGFDTAFFALSGFTIAGSTTEPYLDGMPCTFSPDTTWEEAIGLQLSDIEIKMADGSTRNPVGATYAPAVERNELFTLLTIGRFGFSENLAIASVTIKGSTYSGGGPSYTDKGGDLTFAKWWDVDSHRELEGSGNWIQDGMRGPTNCGHDFDDTTHLIQVVFNGGMKVTFDSNRQLSFDLDQIKHKQMFKVIFGDGSELAADKYLGLADEADGDNYVDICMRLTDADVKKFAEGSAKIRVISTRNCSFLVLPKGDCLNDLVTAECGDCAAESQEICITEIPDVATKCDPKLPSGRYQPYTPTASELEALQDCEYVTPKKVNNFIRNLAIMAVVGVLILCGLCGTCCCYFCRTSAAPQIPEEEWVSEGGAQLTEQAKG